MFSDFLNTRVLNRRGLRILMRTDRPDTYSPSPGPSSPVAGPAVTVKTEVVHKPVAVKVEVTGPPEVSGFQAVSYTCMSVLVSLLGN